MLEHWLNSRKIEDCRSMIVFFLNPIFEARRNQLYFIRSIDFSSDQSFSTLIGHWSIFRKPFRSVRDQTLNSTHLFIDKEMWTYFKVKIHFVCKYLSRSMCIFFLLSLLSVSYARVRFDHARHTYTHWDINRCVWTELLLSLSPLSIYTHTVFFLLIFDLKWPSYT